MKKKHAYDFLEKYPETLEKINSLEQMDTFVAEVCKAVEEIYTCISCKTGCYTCCTAAGLPVAYPVEWQRIRDYLKQLPTDTQELILNSIEGFYERFGNILHYLHGKIGKNISNKDFSIISQSLEHEICPLHINGRCAVYPVRPTACRTFGYFFNRSEENYTEVLSCKSDTTKMKEFFETATIKHPHPPLEKKLRQHMSKFISDKNEIFERTIIPMWLKSDLENGNLDFQAKKSHSFVEKLNNIEKEKFFRIYELNFGKSSYKNENRKQEPDSESPDLILFEISQDLAEKKQWLLAEKILYLLHEKDKNNKNYCFALGKLKLAQENYQEALAYLIKAIKSGMETSEAISKLAFCLEKLGDNTTAKIYYEKAKTLESA